MSLITSSETLAVAFGMNLPNIAANHFIQLFDFNGAPKSDPFIAHQSMITQMVFHPNGQFLATGSGNFLTSSTFDSNLLGSNDAAVRLWNLEGNPIAPPLKGHDKKIIALTFKPESGHLISADCDGRIIYWAVELDAWMEIAEKRILPFKIQKKISKFKSEAERFMKEGDYQKVLDIYSKALQLAPKDGDIYNSRAKTWKILKKWDACLADFSKAIEQDPFNPIFYYNRGKFRITQAHFSDAIDDHTRALELTYQINRPIIPIFKTDFNNQIYEVGKQLWKMSFADNFYHRGIAKYRLGDFKNALFDFDKAVELQLKNKNLFHFRALTKVKLNDLKGALEEINNALAIAKGDSVLIAERKRIFTLLDKEKKGGQTR